MVESEETVREVLGLVPGLLVVDEAYGQFAPWSALELVSDDAPVVVTRTYSKAWSMAGARLGYLVGPRQLGAQLDAVVLPYHLDAVKRAAGRDRKRVWLGKSESDRLESGGGRNNKK